MRYTDVETTMISDFAIKLLELGINTTYVVTYYLTKNSKEWFKNL